MQQMSLRDIFLLTVSFRAIFVAITLGYISRRFSWDVLQKAFYRLDTIIANQLINYVKALNSTNFCYSISLFINAVILTKQLHVNKLLLEK